MPDQPARTSLDASRRERPDDPRVGPADPDERTTVTLYLRSRAQGGVSGRVGREDWAALGGADEADMAAVAAFAEGQGLQVVESDPARRAVRLSGRVGDLAAAFGTEMHLHRGSDGSTYRAREGALTLPGDVAPSVEGVFGLDERPQASTQFRVASASAVSYPPTEVAAAYDAPPGTGAGQCVALVELGGGFRPADLSTYFSSLGLSTPTVTPVPVDGGSNSPGAANGPDGEVMLDIEVVGSIANGASIAVYFAPNTDQGFLDAVTTAVHDSTNKPSIVSISWGGPESTWTAQAMSQMESAFSTAASLGVTIIVAAGDNGSTDGVTDGLQHVDFPASAPHALGCGGTSLRVDDATPTHPTITSEVVWNELTTSEGATGGGVSAQFAVPTYQASAGVPPSANSGGKAGRGVPDVAGDADPETGYAVRVDGTDTVIGGTSAVAPLWAGLLALVNQVLGSDVGFVNPSLYGLAPSAGAFNDIVTGTNGAYSAKPGWDPCTGLGSPRAAALLAALRGTPAAG